MTSLPAALKERDWVLWVTLLFALGLNLLNAFWFFPWGAAHLMGSPLAKLAYLYLPHAVTLALVVGVLILRVDRQRAVDIGFRADNLGWGLSASFVLWLAMNALLAVAAGLQGEPLAWHPGWSNPGVVALLVTLVIGQLLGNALVEEVIYRGYLYTQLERRLARHYGPWVALIGALLASTLIFTAIHLPLRLYSGLEGWPLVLNLSRVFGWGLLYALLYAATRNLYLVTTFHALTNAPTPLLDPTWPPRDALRWLGIALILGVIIYRWLHHTRPIPQPTPPGTPASK